MSKKVSLLKFLVIFMVLFANVANKSHVFELCHEEGDIKFSQPYSSCSDNHQVLTQSSEKDGDQHPEGRHQHKCCHHQVLLAYSHTFKIVFLDQPRANLAVDQIISDPHVLGLFRPPRIL